MKDQKEILNIGVIGCGPIAQFAHFEACRKGKNTRLYAICDRAPDLLRTMGKMWSPEVCYDNYEAMLGDPQLDAVIVATADEYHIPLAIKAVSAQKHVLIEKPMSHSLDDCLKLKEIVSDSNVYIQIGHMKRFDEGIEYAKQFIDDKIGKVVAIKAWYADNTHRYTMTDNLQPIPVLSKSSVKPTVNWKEDLPRYYLLAHGSHLLDTANYLGGKIGRIRAKLKRENDIHCWFVDVDYVNGSIGHLDLTIKIRGDWYEGFTVYGTNGSVFARTYNPWFYKSSDVECYYEPDRTYSRPLAADGFSYRRQLEHFANTILHDQKSKATDIDAGIEVVQGMMAINQSVLDQRPVYLDAIKDGSL